MNVREQKIGITNLSRPTPILQVCLEIFPFFKTPQEIINLITSQRLFLDNNLVTSKETLVTNNQKICFLTTKQQEPFARTDYEIIYEDSHLIIVNKPPFLVVHPAGKYYFKTLTHLLEEKLSQKVYPAHRIDRETSGITLLAKNKQTAEQLREQFSKNEITKTYLACTQNTLEQKQGIINKPLLISTLQVKKETIRDHANINPKGIPAKTSYQVIKESPDKKYSLIECTLHTGRKHQLRAHLASENTPIVGDKEYANHPELFLKYLKGIVDEKELIQNIGATRQLLHAQKIEFTHPITKTFLRINAPVFDDMKLFIENNF
jgi:23S rRNA pseudouridine1911/1915/1917 synthase